MLKNHKWALILSSLAILLPIPVGLLLQAQLPPELHGGLLFGTLWSSLGLLAAQWLCVILTSLDNRDQNRKVSRLVHWIMPAVSWLCCGITCALCLDVAFSPDVWLLAAMGLMFAVIGNYLPKTKMNSTMGIRIPWTYSSEENWNATHRFAGKLWVGGGILILAGAFLPLGFSVGICITALLVMCILPMAYSYRFYRRERGAGKAASAGFSSTDKKIAKAAAVFLAAVLLFVCAVMFLGDIEYTLLENSFSIRADWYSDMTIRYEAVEAMEYRQSDVSGSRVSGYASMRLLMGFFRNEEFGSYTRYTYYKPESCIVLTVSGRTVVLSAENETATQQLYRQLLEKIS